ncbi:MAG: gliding motility protein GldM [Bacteroidetes bacterium]|nr:gliding motility protein GldM [Bacteroidota bacterium]
MGGGKASPRQKMINMMYLVLTALLALNVSKEVLDAFVKANISLMQQEQIMASKNKGTYNELSNQVLLNPNDEKYKQADAQASELSKVTQEMLKKLDRLRLDLLINVEGVDEAGAKKLAENPFEVNKKDDYDMPTNFFGTGEAPGNQGKAGQLKKDLAAFKKELLEMTKNNSAVAKSLEIIDLKDPDPKSETVVKHRLTTWEMKYFYHLPLAAALLELSKWENIVRSSEAEVLKFIWDQISADAVKFDAVRAQIVPKSTFVVSGSNFEADVFLAAYNTAMKPEIVTGGSVDTLTGEVPGGTILDTSKIINGVGRVQIPASGAGERTFAGVINLVEKATGKKVPYPFQTKYTVSPPMASVAATKMNVFYRGLDNPVTVSVPGYPPSQLIVSGSGPISVSGGNGNYVVKANNTGAAKINVSVKTEDGRTISMGSQEFRVKTIPTPVLKWGGKRSGELVPAGLASVSPLIPEMENFDFEVYSRILSFEISYTGQGGLLQRREVTGNQIPGDLQGKIRSMRRGEKVFFSDVVIQLPSGERRKVEGAFKIQ